MARFSTIPNCVCRRSSHTRMNNGSMHPFYTTSRLTGRYCSDLINCIESLESCGSAFLLIKLGLAPVSSRLPTVSLAFDETPTDISMPFVGLWKSMQLHADNHQIPHSMHKVQLSAVPEFLVSQLPQIFSVPRYLIFLMWCYRFVYGVWLMIYSLSRLRCLHLVDSYMEQRLFSSYSSLLVFGMRWCCRHLSYIPTRQRVLWLKRGVHIWGVHLTLHRWCLTVWQWWTSVG